MRRIFIPFATILPRICDSKFPLNKNEQIPNRERIQGDEDRIELLLSEVKGKDITELIASGREKLASVPSDGGGGTVAVSAGAGGGVAPAAAAEAKKEEKVEEKEESDDDMGFSLFD
ncbi:hypothetical protein QQ045_026570 [Rhodiola kirilowii]